MQESGNYTKFASLFLVIEEVKELRNPPET